MRIYSFDQMFGNFGTLAMLKSSIRNDTVPNFTLMSGDSGTGKSSSAEILALSLTCTNRINENPCMSCTSCKNNLLSLQGKGLSNRVKKINLGLNHSKDDVDKLITEVFRLELGEGNSVFILEEVHSLDEIRQTSLLEEIDKLDKNVYVILCTTKPRKLLEELRNRAISFKFSNLKSSDSRLLLEKLVNDFNCSFSEEVKDLILKQCKGVPRKIVLLVDFLKNNPCNYDLILQFLGEINPRLLQVLLSSVDDVNSYYTGINQLIGDYPVHDIIDCMKRYFLDLHFLSCGVGTHHSNTSQSDKKLALSLGRDSLYKIQNVLHSLKYNCEEPDFVYALLKIRSLVISSRDKPKANKEVSEIKSSEIFTPVPSSAIENHLLSEEKRKSINVCDNNRTTALTPNRFKDLLNL